MTKYKLVLLWVICLFCEVITTGGEVVFVNRNVTDSFRVGKDGCTNDASVCTSVSATCQDDGSCLCNFKNPNYRNPVIEITSSELVYGDSYGCIESDIIRFGVSAGSTTGCSFRPFQVIPHSHKDPITKFLHGGPVLSCSTKKALAKFPDNATEMELQWLDESYVNLNVSNNDMYFKWRRSVPDLKGAIITFSLYCVVPSSTGSIGIQTKCLRAKVLGTWSAEAAPVVTEPTTVSSRQPKTSQITSEATSPLTKTRTEAKSTTSNSSNEESSDSNVSTKVFIVLFSISLVVNVVLGIIVWFLWKDRQRNQDKNLQVKEMQNIDEHRRTNTGNEISVYDVVVDSGIHNDGIYDETRPSSGHNNNGRLSDHKYEEPSNYEPLRRNPTQDQSDDHDYQSLTRPQM